MGEVNKNHGWLLTWMWEDCDGYWIRGRLKYETRAEAEAAAKRIRLKDHKIQNLEYYPHLRNNSRFS